MFPLVNKLQRSYFLPFTTPLSLYRERKDLQKLFQKKKKKKKLEEDFLKLINSSTRFDYFDSLAKIPRLYFVQSNTRNALRDEKKEILFEKRIGSSDKNSFTLNQIVN